MIEAPSVQVATKNKIDTAVIDKLRFKLQSGLYYKKLFWPQNMQFVTMNGFKSRAGFNGARKALTMHVI